MRSGLFGVTSRFVQRVAACLLLTVIGCTSRPVTVEEEVPEVQARLMAIRDAYSAFSEQAGRPPRNEQDLRRFLESENPDETLVSPRDGQPFVICYGVDVYDANWAKPDSTPVVVYEQQGVDSRWVLAPPGMIYEMGEEEFSKASFPPGHKAQN